MKSKSYFFVIALVTLSTSARSQTNFIAESQAWFRYYNQTQLSKKIILHAELDKRMQVDPWNKSQLFTHLHVHYRIKPWLDIAAGMNYNLTTIVHTNYTLNVPEWRPWQEASVFKTMGKNLLLQFRYRLDERFIHQNDGQVLADGYHFNWRHRFRIQLSKPIVEFESHRILTLKLSNEVMLNSGDVKRPFDQNRTTTSLEFTLNKKLAIETGFLYLIQQVADHTFNERYIIRTTLHHRIGNN